MVYMLGGASDFVENPMKYMPKAPITAPVFANKKGYVCAMNTRQIGLLLVDLKGARTRPEQTVNHATGLTDFCQIGDYIDEKTPLCFVHAANEADFQNAANKLQTLIQIGEKPDVSPVVKQEIGL